MWNKIGMLRITSMFMLVLSRESLGEPACSKYHYEEQTLHKVMRLEFEVERIVKETQSVLEDTRKEMAAIRKERDALEKALAKSQAELREKMDDEWSKRQTSDMDAFRANLTASVKVTDMSVTPTVWFLAKDPTDISPATNQIIIYGTVIENVGGGYDATTGKFAAPVQGVYAFTIHACAHSTYGWYYTFMKNDTVLLSGRDYESDSGFPCTSATTYTVMNAGDMVYIKWWNGGSLTQIHTTDSFWNSFTGVLLHV